MDNLKNNTISIIIDRPIHDVFEFTTNPKNTHLWLPFIKEEVSDQYPPGIGSKYRNRGENSDWDVYEVLFFENNQLFMLSKGYYFVKYSYRSIDENSTEMVYTEWTIGKDEYLENPFTQDLLENLKTVMEK